MKVGIRLNSLVKAAIFSFSTVLMSLSFQNCAQQTGVDALNPSVASGQDPYKVGEEKVVKDIDPTMSSFIDLSLRSIFSEADKKINPKDLNNMNVKINVENGEMRMVNFEGEYTSQVRLCMQPQELAEFRLMLSRLQICTPDTSQLVGTNSVCTQVYKYPYARLHFSNGNKVKLGEQAGCNRSLVLCENSIDEFNGFIAYLRSHIDNRNCL